MQLEFKEDTEIITVSDNQRIKKKVGFVLPLDKWEGLVQEVLTDQYYPLADIWRCIGLFLNGGSLRSFIGPERLNALQSMGKNYSIKNCPSQNYWCPHSEALIR